MSTLLRMRRDLDDEIRRALAIPHAFALERVVFAFGRRGGDNMLLLSSFVPVEDGDYVDDHRVGARINAQAIHKALQHAYSNGLGAFHVHLHDHLGMPWFSPTDRRELPDVMTPFRHLIPDQPHGLLLLSEDDAVAQCWWPGDRKPRAVRNVSIVGVPIRLLRGERP